MLGAVAFLWPMPAHLDTHIWGDRFDAWTTLWLIDHLAEGLRTGTLSAHTDQILFPIGYSLWSFGHAALQGIGALMVAVGMPLIASYNLLLIGGIATTGFAAHLLGRELGGSHAAGFVAGGAMASSPYLYGEGAAGCIELTAAGLLPLFAWTMVRLARSPTWARMLQSAVALAIIGPFNWYYTLFTGMFGLGFVAWMAAQGKRRAVALALAAMTLAGALNAPLIPLVRQETPTRPAIEPAAFADAETWTRAKEVADVRVDLAALTDDRMLELDALQVLQNSTRLPALLTADFPVNPLDSTPGRLAWLVGLVGFAAAPRRTVGWVAIAGGAAVLTLGPFLTVDGTPPLPVWSAETPLPYFYAYEHLPFFSKAYRPYRIGVIALMCLGAAGAAGLGSLRLRPRICGSIAAAVLIVGFSQPHWVSGRPATRPLADAATPPIYERLATAPEGAVIEVPLAYQPFSVANSRFQYNQVAHGKPLLNCNQLIRRTDLAAFRAYVLDNGLLRTLVDLARQPPPYAFTGADLTALVDDGFRYLVVHRKVEADSVQLAGDIGPADLLGLPALELVELALGAPAMEDADAAIYRFPDGVSPTRSYSLEADGYDEVALDLDAQNLGLPVVLHPGDSLPLWTGQARRLGFWARVDEPGVGVQIAPVDGSPTVVPLAVDPGHWTWIEVPVESEGELALALVGTGLDERGAPRDAPGQLAFTRVQVALR